VVHVIDPAISESRPTAGVDRPDSQALVVVVTGVGGMIEILVIVGKRLSWLIGEDTAVEFPDGTSNWGAGGFEVALHADFELEVGGESCRVDDRAANCG